MEIIVKDFAKIEASNKKTVSVNDVENIYELTKEIMPTENPEGLFLRRRRLC